MPRKIDFFIIGAYKAGTTSLHDYLKQHPHIFLPNKKETRYFREDEFYNIGEEYLEKQYKEIRNEKVIGGTDVNLIYFLYALRRLYQYNPHIKLIAVLRNPIDRAYSDYWYARSNGWDSCKTFEEALEKEPERCEGSLFEQAAFTYLSHGHYYEQIKRLLSMFTRKHLYVMLTDDLKDSAKETIKSTLSWLEVDPNIAAIDTIQKSNQSRIPKSLWLQRVLTSSDAWYQKLFKKFIKPKSRYLPNLIIERILKKNIKPFNYPPMNKETRLRLSTYFEPHNEKLAKFIGRDLRHWR